jgi:hypothetical protein
MAIPPQSTKIKISQVNPMPLLRTMDSEVIGEKRLEVCFGPKADKYCGAANDMWVK